MDEFFNLFDLDSLKDSIKITQENMVSVPKELKSNSYLVLRELFFSDSYDIGTEEAYNEMDDIKDYYEEIILPAISDIIFEDHYEESILNKKMVSILLEPDFASDLFALVKIDGEYKIYDKQTYVTKAIKNLLSEDLDFYKLIINNEKSK